MSVSPTLHINDPDTVREYKGVQQNGDSHDPD